MADKVHRLSLAASRSILWKEDDILKSDLKKYVKEDLRRTEILDFMKRDFSQYAWSLSSLDRRMRYCKCTEAGICIRLFNSWIGILQIERWWKELHDRLEKYFKDHLRWLKDQNHYDPNDETNR